MNRYNNIPTKLGSNPNTTPQDNIPRYVTTKYPNIPVSFQDIYVYTGIGDRYDLLAQVYYNDSSLWWVISRANYNLSKDSIIPPIGSQIRIPNPNRIQSIISNYESLNLI
jgi:hypothetical protein